jgi:PKD repeat protein/sugar lactone lactonase YvrE
MRSMTSVTMRRLPHGLMVVLVVVGVGLAFLISGSAAHADTIVRGGLNPEGVAVDASGDVFIADAGNNRVVVDKPNGSGGYTQSVVDDSGLSFPEGVAVDASGDVFIADTNDNRVVVDKPNGSGGYTQSVVDDDLSSPGGVAVNAFGDVVIADAGNNRVVVDKPNGVSGYTQSVVDSTGLAQLQGVAVDRSGDVFIADAGYNRVVVDKPNGSGGYTQSVVDSTGLAYPQGVALDGSGDVFIADTGNARVVVDKPNGSGGYTQSAVDDTGLSYPAAVAVDASGDVLIADTSHSRVVLDKPNGSGGYTQSVVDDSGLSFPAGVAVDVSGDVFIADSGNNRVVLDKPNGSGGYTQSVVDDDLSSPGGVAVDVSGDVFIADGGNNRVVVDKPNGSGGNTQSVVDSTGLAYPQGVAVDGSGDVFISDTGHNRVVVDKPNGSGGYTQSVVDSTGLNEPFGVAVNASGDVFIADAYNNRVLVDKPNGSGGYTRSVVDTDLSTPYGVAVNASAGVFIADTDNQRVLDEKPNGSGGYTQRVVDAGLSSPAGVAVDGAGDVFIAEYEPNGSVGEHPAGAPAAAFTSAQSAGSLTVAFTDASSVASPTTITGWSWNFGDGSPLSSAEDPTHSYAAPGSVTVSLTVTDSRGQTSTDSQQIVVAWPRASLTYPTVGQTNVNTATPFSWADIPAGQGYQLWIGTGPGGGSLLESGALSASTSTYQVPALPTGVTLWARLYTEVAGSWNNYQDVPFTVTASRDAFTYPTAGQQNINTLTPFSWSPATNAQAYQLTIGTKPGTADLVNSGTLASNITNYRVPALPTGKTLYAKIVSKFAGGWFDYQAISFTAAPNPVAFTNPTQGQTGVITPATFTWSTSPAATGYQLWIGVSHHGSGSLLKSGWLRPSTSSYPVPALPAGQPLYARIYTGVASGWGNYQDITFTTAAASTGSSSATAIRQRAVTNQLTSTAADQPTPAWMRRLLRLEPDLHRSLRARHG